MRRNVAFLFVAVLLAVPALAAGGYTFDIRVTDGRSGLLSNPDYPNMTLEPGMLERAAGSRVVVLDGSTGTRWRWLMLSWFDNDPSVEQAVGVRGGIREEADFALLAGRAGHFRLRCLRDECAFTVKGEKEGETSFTVKRDAVSPDLLLPARVTIGSR